MMSTEEEKLKQQHEAAQKAKEEEERKKKEEEEKLAKEKEEEEKLKKIMGDSEAVANLLEAKRKANAEARQYRLELEKLKKDREEAEKKALEEQGKFKELAEKTEAEKKELEAKVKDMMISRALEVEAIKQKIRDTDGVKLADRSKITIDNDYNVEGVEEAIEALKESKPYLFEQEEDVKTRQPERSTKPGIRERILGQEATSQEGVQPTERIRRGLEKQRK